MNQFDLSAQGFSDCLTLQYKKSLVQMPTSCDGYGAPFSTEHHQDCRFGDFVGCRHDEVHDAIGDLASLE